MIKFSVPLVINNISLWFYTGGNKVIIQNYLGASENGLYSFASRFSLLISLFSTVISMAVIEESYSFSTLEEYKTKISKLITIISKAYFSLITLALPAIYILYSLAFKRSVYYPSQDYIFLLLLASLFTALSNNFGSAFQVTDKTQYIVVTTIIGAAASIGVSLILVGSLGIYGVLLGGAIGPFLMMLSRAIFAKRATNLKLNWLNNILIFGVGCVFYIGLRVNKSILIQFTILFIALLFTIFQYRSELFELKSRLERKRG
ncbi:hypothetical protein SDC9_125549 [bioreactor metagenome]|uniref:Uncharacterized protein n=1 Tax=bioreactor metagenome TaxID=1076179 RepID=A0A645CNQ2_9ZZZZ